MAAMVGTCRSVIAAAERRERLLRGDSGHSRINGRDDAPRFRIERPLELKPHGRMGWSSGECRLLRESQVNGFLSLPAGFGRSQNERAVSSYASHLSAHFARGRDGRRCSPIVGGSNE
jgi:hypothetical protein